MYIVYIQQVVKVLKNIYVINYKSNYHPLVNSLLGRIIDSFFFFFGSLFLYILCMCMCVCVVCIRVISSRASGNIELCTIPSPFLLRNNSGRERSILFDSTASNVRYSRDARTAQFFGPSAVCLSHIILMSRIFINVRIYIMSYIAECLFIATLHDVTTVICIYLFIFFAIYVRDNIDSL